MSGEWKRKESQPKILFSYLPLQLSHFLPATFPPHPLPNPPAMYIITFLRLKYKAIFFFTTHSLCNFASPYPYSFQYLYVIFNDLCYTDKKNYYNQVRKGLKKEKNL